MKTKILILLLAFCGGIASAQKKATVEEMYWGADDAYKNATAVPDKWKNESAVIIYKFENYKFEKMVSVAGIRKRVKLQDQAAVTVYSEFSFKKQFMRGTNYWSKKNNSFVGIKVIKPNGTEKIVDIKEETVKVEEGTKIAIPNLEVGDIIDYYIHSGESLTFSGNNRFDPVETTLSDEYPIMDLKVGINKNDKEVFLNFKSYNGAPELKQVEGRKGEYEFYAKDIEKNSFPRWFMPLTELPCYKFQAYYGRGFMSEDNSIIKSDVSKDNIKKFYFDLYRAMGDLGDIEKFLKGKTFKDDEEKVKAVYYFMRYQYNTRFIEARVAVQSKILNVEDAFFGNYPMLIDTEGHFTNHFMAFLKDNKLSYDLILATPRENGDIKDLLLIDNAKIILRVNTQNPVYLTLFDSYQTPGFDYSVEGTNAYLLEITKHRVTAVSDFKIPASTYKDNFAKEIVSVSLTDDFSGLNIVKESSLYGYIKKDEQPEKLEFYDFVNEDYEKYGTKSLVELIKKDKKKEQFEREYAALKNKLKDKKIDELKESLKGEYDAEVTDPRLEIIKTGRYEDEPLVYKQSFTIKNSLVKKTGPNYVLEIGKLIGGQVDISEKERNRVNNIYLPFPRSYNDEITFTIPAGYTVSGLEKLNKSVENSTGGFVSTAKIDGNKLVINVTKHYTNYYEPVTNWKSMTDFLDAAYQFTQEKILLKKS